MSAEPARDVTALPPIAPGVEIGARAAYEETRSPGFPAWEELGDYRRRLECRAFAAGLRAITGG